MNCVLWVITAAALVVAVVVWARSRRAKKAQAFVRRLSRDYGG